MKRKGITYKLTPYSLWVSWPYLLVLLLIAAPAFVIPEVMSPLFRVIAYSATLVIVTLLVYGLYRLYIGVLVAQRQKRFDAYLAAIPGTMARLEVPSDQFATAAFNRLGSPTGKDVRNRRYMNGLEGEGWAYADYAYDVYAQSKSSAYSFSTDYYSVFSMRLPRQVPNILFDSRRSRGRQFRTMFAGDQIHHLEGDFDKFFTTYIPYTYTIDAYSFISPEVLWAIREAADYDVEIVSDTLYLMGPMGEPDFVVSDMHAKALGIYNALVDNLKNYRDERLPYTEGRKAVSPLGAQLFESNVKMLVGFVATLLSYMFMAIPLASTTRQFVILESIVTVGVTGVFGYKLYANWREKQRLKQAGYYATHRTFFRRGTVNRVNWK